MCGCCRVSPARTPKWPALRNVTNTLAETRVKKRLIYGQPMLSGANPAKQAQQPRLILHSSINQELFNMRAKRDTFAFTLLLDNCLLSIVRHRLKSLNILFQRIRQLDRAEVIEMFFSSITSMHLPLRKVFHCQQVADMTNRFINQEAAKEESSEPSSPFTASPLNHLR